MAGFLTYLGAPAAERFVGVTSAWSGACAAVCGGIIAALVAFSLMPPAIHGGPMLFVVLAFLIGGALFVSGRILCDPTAGGPKNQRLGQSPVLGISLKRLSKKGRSFLLRTAS